MAFGAAIVSFSSRLNWDFPFSRFRFDEKFDAAQNERKTAMRPEKTRNTTNEETKRNEAHVKRASSSAT